MTTATELHHYQYYPGDFQKKTRHLSLLEKAAYREILDEIWLTGQATCSIPDDDVYIAGVLKIAVEDWLPIRAKLIGGPRPVLIARNGQITNNRLREELEYARILAESQSEKGKKSGQSRRLAAARARIAADEPELNRGSTAVQPKLNHPNPNPEPEPIEAKNPPNPHARAKAEDPRVEEAIREYRLLGTERKIPGLTDRAAQRLRPKIRTVTDELEAECEGFTWTECLRRARGQPFIWERISSFDFEWFLKREKDGTRLNAKKVWNEQFADFRKQPGDGRTDRRRAQGEDREGARVGGSDAAAAIDWNAEAKRLTERNRAKRAAGGE